MTKINTTQISDYIKDKKNIGKCIEVIDSYDGVTKFLLIDDNFRSNWNLFHIPYTKYITNDWHHRAIRFNKALIIERLMFVKEASLISKNQAVDWTIDYVVTKLEKNKEK